MTPKPGLDDALETACSRPVAGASTRFRPAASGRLPIYRQDRPPNVWFYAPGYLVVTSQARAELMEEELARPTGVGDGLASALLQAAERACQAWDEFARRPFSPTCLTLYLHNECNLACGYCYANSQAPARASDARRLSLAAVEAAAELVASNCRARRQPFTLVLHGGGEPSLDQALANRALDIVEEIAASHDLPVFRYIATNGVMTESKAAWLAQRFDLIGVSCDGPEDIQAAQRPLPNGASSAPLVERTARLIRAMGKPLHVRVTVTPQSMSRQAEIADYLCRAFKPQEIHVEPVYRFGRARHGINFEAHQADAFVEAFVQARRVAQAHGVRWVTSGSRPWEIHGPFCHVLRDVLNLTPGEAATGCFRVSEGDDPGMRVVEVARFEGRSGQMVFLAEQILRLRQAACALPSRCQQCFNRFHCARGCPEICALDEPVLDESPAPGFRCLFQARLVEACLEETARALRLQLDREGAAGSQVVV